MGFSVRGDISTPGPQTGEGLTVFLMSLRTSPSPRAGIVLRSLSRPHLLRPPRAAPEKPVKSTRTTGPAVVWGPERGTGRPRPAVSSWGKVQTLQEVSSTRVLFLRTCVFHVTV